MSTENKNEQTQNEKTMIDSDGYFDDGDEDTEDYNYSCLDFLRDIVRLLLWKLT